MYSFQTNLVWLLCFMAAIALFRVSIAVRRYNGHGNIYKAKHSNRVGFLFKCLDHCHHGGKHGKHGGNHIGNMALKR